MNRPELESFIDSRWERNSAVGTVVYRITGVTKDGMLENAIEGGSGGSPAPLSWFKNCCHRLPDDLTSVRSGICIVAAAILQDGKIWSVPAPGRHHDVIQFMDKCGVPLTAPLEEQGFLLSNGTFCRRTTAKLIAVTAGQFRSSAGEERTELYSEDVW